MTSKKAQLLSEKIAMLNPVILSLIYAFYALSMPAIFYYEVKYLWVEVAKVLLFLMILAMFIIWPISAFWFARNNAVSKNSLTETVVHILSVIALLFILAFIPWLINEPGTERLMENSFIEYVFAIVSTLGALALPALVWFTSSQIVRTEREKGIMAPGVIVTIIQIIYIPIGIWWLHKRFVKIKTL